MAESNKAKSVQEEVDAKSVQEEIDLESLVTVIVPRDDSPKKSKTLKLELNGKCITIPRGVACEIPYKYKLLLEKKAIIRALDDEYKEELQFATQNP